MPLTGGNDWWRRAVFYQVYPRSFQDTNGDGIGDLQGIIDRLDYLNDGTDRCLGIDAIWLSPTYPSPMKDFGYDVTDYCDVHADFGDLATMDRLIDECHRRGIRVLLDYVPNHTSDLHPWFMESRASRDNPKRDWYVWRDAKPDGSLPNNWRAVFGGPAWEYDERTKQYYLHSFLVEQPDLNWRNPEVMAAMHDVLRFWLRRGVDGFRIDVMGMIVKHPDLADNVERPDWVPGAPFPRYLVQNNRNHPDVYEAVRGIRRVLEEFPGSTAVGEVFGTPEEIGHFYGDAALDGLPLVFNFRLINEVEPAITPWTAEAIRRVINAAEAALPLGAQPCLPSTITTSRGSSAGTTRMGTARNERAAPPCCYWAYARPRSSTTARRSGWSMSPFPRSVSATRRESTRSGAIPNERLCSGPALLHANFHWSSRGCPTGRSRQTCPIRVTILTRCSPCTAARFAFGGATGR
jgi:alpha-glucosidase